MHRLLPSSFPSSFSRSIPICQPSTSYSQTITQSRCRVHVQRVRASRTGNMPLVLDDSFDEATLLHEALEETRRAGTADGLNVIAFSGGVDSSLVAALVLRAYGPAHALACIGVSPSLAALQLDRARAVAAALALPTLETPTAEGSQPGYLANEGEACLFCKTTLYATLEAVGAAAARTAAREGRGSLVLFNGTNADDLTDPTRLGLIAAKEFEVASPLSRLTKAAVRKLARYVGLPNWDWAAAPCLRSRLQFGIEASPNRLATVEQAEMTVLQILDLPPQESFRVRIVQAPAADVEGDADVRMPAESERLTAVVALDPARLGAVGSAQKAAVEAALEGLGFGSVGWSAFRSGELSGYAALNLKGSA